LINFGNKHSYAGEVQAKPAVAENPPAPAKNGNGFTRYAGYDNENDFRKFIADLYADTKNNGIFIDKSIPNPSNPEVNAISSAIDMQAEFSDAYVKSCIIRISGNMIDFSKIGSSPSPSQAGDIFCEVMNILKSKAIMSNALKNAFIKFICWCIRYSTFKITNILYIGEISKYEVCWLYIMHRLGCKVNYICFTGDSSYLSADPESRFSHLVKGAMTASLNISFKNINTADIQNQKKMQNMLSVSSSLTVDCSIPVLRENFEKEILNEYSIRTGSFGNCFDNGKIAVHFTAFIGYREESEYKNFLYNLRENIINKSKKTLIFAESLKKPSYDEGAAFLSVNRSDINSMIAELTERIEIKNCPARTVLARKNFIETLRKYSQSETKIQRIFNLGVNMIIWLKMCTQSADFKADIPLMMYYGKISAQELIFLKFLCRTGFDVIYICSDKSVFDTVKNENDGIIQIFEDSLSCDMFPYPDKPVRAKYATSAYNAERELDTLLYNDGNLFRNRQFAVCRSVTLKTTYEEIDILWNQEAKYRTGFSSDEKIVTVPNIFAKISGINDGDETEYWKNIASKITSSSMVFKSLPFFVPSGADNYNGFFSKTDIDIQKLMQSTHNRYNYMNDNIQYFIFSKMQEVIDSGFLNLPYPDIMHLVIKTGLNLGTEILRIIQNYDFTKDIPKIIIIDNIQQTFNVYECIYLVLLNLMAFDIIIYTPTGYKNLETYISPQAYETYTMNRFRDNLRIPPNLHSLKSSGGGIFGGLFRRR
jgi:hypothetical protein